MFAHVFACLFYFLIGKVDSKEPLCCHEAESVKARSNCGDSLHTFHFTVCVGAGVREAWVEWGGCSRPHCETAGQQLTNPHVPQSSARLRECIN